MNLLQVRPVCAADLAALGDFERNNREAFEEFNEPRSNAHYSPVGIARAFHLLMAGELSGKVLTRVVVAPDESDWLAKGGLTLHDAGHEVVAMLVYQTDRLHWRRGVATALLKELLWNAVQQGATRVLAQVCFDNLVSLHLLRRAGFQASGWTAPARLHRGTVDCLELSRLLRTVDAADLPRAHMDLPA